MRVKKALLSLGKLYSAIFLANCLFYVGGVVFLLFWTVFLIDGIKPGVWDWHPFHCLCRNKYIPLSFSKMKYTPYSQLLQTKQATTKQKTNNLHHQTKQTRAFRWHKNLPGLRSKEFTVSKSHSCLLLSEIPSKDQEAKIQLWKPAVLCSGRMSVQFSEGETKDQNLASTTKNMGV